MYGAAWTSTDLVCTVDIIPIAYKISTMYLCATLLCEQKRLNARILPIVEFWECGQITEYDFSGFTAPGGLGAGAASAGDSETYAWLRVSVTFKFIASTHLRFQISGMLRR